MKTTHTPPRNIDEYIAGFPDDVQERLEKIRRTITKAAPDAEEAIKYRMPTFTLNGMERAEGKRKKRKVTRKIRP